MPVALVCGVGFFRGGVLMGEGLLGARSGVRQGRYDRQAAPNSAGRGSVLA
ncbi:hypothetical protein GCM10022227_08740 [Streptomyces sedi]